MVKEGDQLYKSTLMRDRHEVVQVVSTSSRLNAKNPTGHQKGGGVPFNIKAFSAIWQQEDCILNALVAGSATTGGLPETGAQPPCHAVSTSYQRHAPPINLTGQTLIMNQQASLANSLTTKDASRKKLTDAQALRHAACSTASVAPSSQHPQKREVLPALKVTERPGSKQEHRKHSRRRQEENGEHRSGWKSARSHTCVDLSSVSQLPLKREGEGPNCSLPSTESAVQVECTIHAGHAWSHHHAVGLPNSLSIHTQLGKMTSLPSAAAGHGRNHHRKPTAVSRVLPLHAISQHAIHLCDENLSRMGTSSSLGKAGEVAEPGECGKTLQPRLKGSSLQSVLDLQIKRPRGRPLGWRKAIGGEATSLSCVNDKLGSSLVKSTALEDCHTGAEFMELPSERQRGSFVRTPSSVRGSEVEGSGHHSTTTVGCKLQGGIPSRSGKVGRPHLADRPSSSQQGTAEMRGAGPPLLRHSDSQQGTAGIRRAGRPPLMRPSSSQHGTVDRPPLMRPSSSQHGTVGRPPKNPASLPNHSFRHSVEVDPASSSDHTGLDSHDTPPMGEALAEVLKKIRACTKGFEYSIRSSKRAIQSDGTACLRRYLYCTVSGCPARKSVDFSLSSPCTVIRVLRHGQHNHVSPRLGMKKPLAGSSPHRIKSSFSMANDAAWRIDSKLTPHWRKVQKYRSMRVLVSAL
ncbi:hypothetical protein CEUSTIGMA_g974.t1 [Chlamydomonas eustigma]|uniref:WRKY domain-containing protein n=1 Tax=Chlamydomonas eustigma TaxID=1157962 RepID=A0A250WS76_9CHLO|nr:hypothetical protein CEUSTIGMA_g974.t1 [Chlamydomonas eustigma]|eukprot:GAX73522.1 hypothetical protein CEUSTIGMA_g974.t1 [Chlamydomonas eustigma]